MKWTKTKICMLLISWLVLHAPILQAQLLACEQECRTQCNQPCVDAVPTVQECLIANPTFPPPACFAQNSLGISLCESVVTNVELVCESSCVSAYPGGCPVGNIGVGGAAGAAETAPTLSEWMLVLLALVLGGIGYTAIMKIRKP